MKFKTEPDYYSFEGRFEILRGALKEQVETVPYEFTPGQYVPSKILTPIPYLNDRESIRFLHCGLEIEIFKNGRWDWADTTGG